MTQPRRRIRKTAMVPARPIASDSPLGRLLRLIAERIIGDPPRDKSVGFVSQAERRGELN